MYCIFYFLFFSVTRPVAYSVKRREREKKKKKKKTKALHITAYLRVFIIMFT